MKTVRDVFIGLMITLIIVAFVNGGTMKSELYTILKLQGCDGGCTDEQIIYLVSLPRAEIGGSVIFNSPDNREIYKLTFISKDSNNVETILDTR